MAHGALVLVMTLPLHNTTKRTGAGDEGSSLHSDFYYSQEVAQPKVQHRFNSLMSARKTERASQQASQSLWMEMCLDIEGSVAAADQSQQVISSQPAGLRIKLRNETLMPGFECLCGFRLQEVLKPFTEAKVAVCITVHGDLMNGGLGQSSGSYNLPRNKAVKSMCL